MALGLGGFSDGMGGRNSEGMGGGGSSTSTPTVSKPSVPSSSTASKSEEPTTTQVVIVGFILFLIFGGIIAGIVIAAKSDFTNPRKNELVFYHAGWCGYCKEFMPVFDATVPALKERFPDLTVTKYKDEKDRDAIRKASPRVDGFPTIRLNGKEFEGPRTPEGLLAFVQANYHM